MNNLGLLKTKIDSSGYKLSFIAKELGITVQSLTNKVEGRTEFKGSEIAGIKTILKLSRTDIDKIFFS